VLTGFGNLSTLKSIKNLLKPPAGHIPYQQDGDIFRRTMIPTSRTTKTSAGQ
jgi:hypothetical protein